MRQIDDFIKHVSTFWYNCCRKEWHCTMHVLLSWTGMCLALYRACSVMDRNVVGTVPCMFCCHGQQCGWHCTVHVLLSWTGMWLALYRACSVVMDRNLECAGSHLGLLSCECKVTTTLNTGKHTHRHSITPQKTHLISKHVLITSYLMTISFFLFREENYPLQ
jgi:hypothetical protein